MSTITREQLHERAREKVKSLEFAVTQTAFADSRAELEEELELARIALASLEADPVAWLLSGGGAKNNVSFDSGNAYADPLREVTPLYTAPPATVSVPDGVLKNLLPDAEKPEFWFEHNGTIFFEGVKFNNAVFDACRAAMLQGAENAESRCTIQTAPVLDSLLKKAESRCSNSPMALDGWVACSDRMPEDDDFVYIWPRPDFGVELHVGQYCECHPKGDGWYAQVYEQNYGIEWYPINVTHWIPLPAAPQQEVKP
ncbi:TPA: DUF551 domain-containing protein [Enterobacter roggenkampii]